MVIRGGQQKKPICNCLVLQSCAHEKKELIWTHYGMDNIVKYTLPLSLNYEPFDFSAGLNPLSETFNKS